MEIRGYTPYPKWVQIIAEEEWVLQHYENDNIYNIGSQSSNVHKCFLRERSRQGDETWRQIYREQDYTLLKKRAIDNGYRSSDGLFNKDGKLDYIKLPTDTPTDTPTDIPTDIPTDTYTDMPF